MPHELAVLPPSLDGFVLQLREAADVELRHAGVVVGEALWQEVEVLEAGARHQVLVMASRVVRRGRGINVQ